MNEFQWIPNLSYLANEPLVTPLVVEVATFVTPLLTPLTPFVAPLKTSFTSPPSMVFVVLFKEKDQWSQWHALVEWPTMMILWRKKVYARLLPDTD